MRVALTADWQFDEGINLSTVCDGGIYSRLQDQVDCFHWMMAAAKGHSCTQLVVAGDLFESRTEISVMVLDQVGRLLHKASSAFQLVHLLVGNHDTYLRTPSMSALHTLRSQVVKIHDQPVALESGLAFLPWDDDPEQISRWAQSLVGEGNYLVGHLTLAGLFPKRGGVSIESLSPERWEYVLLGDIHDPLTIEGYPNVRYIGSPLQLDYGDAGKPRGFYILDTNAGELTYVENEASPRFHVVETEPQVDSVRSGDFARVTPDLATRVCLRTGRVEIRGEAKDLAPSPSRLATSERGEAMLREYCELKNVPQDDVDRLVTLGMELLQEGA